MDIPELIDAHSSGPQKLRDAACHGRIVRPCRRANDRQRAIGTGGQAASGTPRDWPWSSFHRWVQAGVYPEHWAYWENAGLLDFGDIDKTVGE